MKSLLQKLEEDCTRKEIKKDDPELLLDDEETWKFEPAVPGWMKKAVSKTYFIWGPALLLLAQTNGTSYAEARKLLAENNYDREVVEQKIDEKYAETFLEELLKGLKAPGRDIAYWLHAEK